MVLVIRKGLANFFAREKVENIFPRNTIYSLLAAYSVGLPLTKREIR